MIVENMPPSATPLRPAQFSQHLAEESAPNFVLQNVRRNLGGLPRFILGRPRQSRRQRREIASLHCKFRRSRHLQGLR
jgi:hypothetical protein